MSMDLGPLLFFIAILFIILGSSRRTETTVPVKEVGPDDFLEMIDHFKIDLIIVEYRLWASERASFIYKGWKFTSKMKGDHEYPAHVNIVGREVPTTNSSLPQRTVVLHKDS